MNHHDQRPRSRITYSICRNQSIIEGRNFMPLTDHKSVASALKQKPKNLRKRLKHSNKYTSYIQHIILRKRDIFNRNVSYSEPPADHTTCAGWTKNKH